MLRIAICDDMPDILEQTKQAILQWNSVSEVIHIETFSDGDALISAHQNKPFHIILLDVVMPLMNGIETAREIRQTDQNVKIVFLTTSSDYAVESYTVKADNYLLKPLIPEQLYTCLNDLYAQIVTAVKSVIIKTATAIHRVSISGIEYLEAQNKQVLFTMVDGSSILSTKPLYSFGDELLLSDGFFKCHRSYIVNMNQIEAYTQKEIKMRSGCRIPISRSCHKEFESAYFELLFGKAGEL